VAVCYHSDTPDSTGKELPGRQQRLNAKLRLPPGVPVFRILRTVYDSEGHPVEVQDSVAAGDRHGFCYEVDMR
jgi:hypothetical protein